MEELARLGDGALLAIGGADDAQPMDVDEEANDYDDDLIEEEMLALCMLMNILLMVSLSQLDGRSIRGPIQEHVVIQTDFFPKLKARRSPTAYKKTLRCLPDSFDGLVRLLGPLYYRKYGLPGQNTQYHFDFGLAALLAYYGNSCGIDGDGIGGAAAQLGISRTVAGVYIKRLEDVLYEMMPEVIYFPAPTALEEWSELVEGFVERRSNFPDVACIFDGTIIKTRRPRDHMRTNGFYDKNGKTSYNGLAAIDFRGKFRFIGVFFGQQLRSINVEPV
ncbi:hypothetical protein F441_18343 [Phytophthora nicotianae CJ01A1]|uniref:DDE Tnp4 domain-containing protein n=1 Tax=Phytophthora nicotianae CJ01A1 TaxID=1317063 RepID=W2W316_PHYNI|nr:hypothetical protein F441_18343 [Phytophthora nicotianae CJ01A1]